MNLKFIKNRNVVNSKNKKNDIYIPFFMIGRIQQIMKLN